MHICIVNQNRIHILHYKYSLRVTTQTSESTPAEASQVSQAHIYASLVGLANHRCRRLISRTHASPLRRRAGCEFRAGFSRRTRRGDLEKDDGAALYDYLEMCELTYG